MDAPVDPIWEYRVDFEAYTDDMAREMLEALTEGVARINEIWFQSPETPGPVPCSLIEAGVRYVFPTACPGSDKPCQTIRSAPAILATGRATCIDIAAYMVAQHRLRGEKAWAVFENMVDAYGQEIPGQYHVLVGTPNGVFDYTQDLIDGEAAAMNAACSRRIR